MPILRLFDGLPRRAFSVAAAAFLGGILAAFLYVVADVQKKEIKGCRAEIELALAGCCCAVAGMQEKRTVGRKEGIKLALMTAALTI